MKSKCCGAEVKTFLHCSECGKVDWTAEGESAADEILKKCFDNSNQGTSQEGTMSAKDEKITELVCGYCTKEITCCEKCRRKEELSKMIAEAQLEAVEKAFSLRPLSLCVNYDESITAYMHKLKKAAGK